MVDEDYHAWVEYPDHRWVFNKLEMALRFGYDAGPACVPITKSGRYIVRPIYNLYGMGIGATIKDLDLDLHADDMMHHKHVPPGYFWCEYLEGNHYSATYSKEDKGFYHEWRLLHNWQGWNDKSNDFATHSSIFYHFFNGYNKRNGCRYNDISIMSWRCYFKYNNQAG